jgi:hypothetical protein
MIRAPELQGSPSTIRIYFVCMGSKPSRSGSKTGGIYFEGERNALPERMQHSHHHAKDNTTEYQDVQCNVISVPGVRVVEVILLFFPGGKNKAHLPDNGDPLPEFYSFHVGEFLVIKSYG